MAAGDERRTIEYAKCAADPAYFLHHYGVIDDAQDHGDGGGTMPFRLWPAQARVLWKFLTGVLFIILKARQLGISWLCCGYALWLCVFAPGKVVLIFSKGQKEANELLRRVKVLYERLPDWLIQTLPARVKDNTEIQQWANGSYVLSLSGKGGRSFTASLVIMDEAAHNEHANEMYIAIKPTIDAGGQLIMLSTANGLGNLFHLVWTRAEAGLNRFVAIFLPWWARPERTAAWYEMQKGEYTDPDMIHQEYPRTAREAFVSTGRLRFRTDWITAQEAKAAGEIAVPHALRHLEGNLTVYHVPPKDTESGKLTRRYIIGGDVAEGGEKGDYSVAVVIDRETWEEAATFSAHIEPDAFAQVLLDLSAFYADGDGDGAMIVPERNNHGHAVIATLKTKLQTERVYRDRAKKMGWLTTAQSKPLMIDLLAEALRDDLLTVHSPASLAEMQIYAIDKDGDTNAPNGYHDDRVMAWAIAIAAARSRRVHEDVW